MLQIKAFFILTTFLVLQGCGFHPLYSPQTSKNSVFVAPIQDREGQILRNKLQHFFRTDTKKNQDSYRLNVSLKTTKGELGFRRDETSRRTRLTLIAQYTLTDTKTQKIILNQKTSVLTGYSVGSSSSFASLPLIVSEKDAIKRALAQLAHDIHISVASFLGTDTLSNSNDEA